MSTFDLVTKLSSFQHFHTDVNGVLRLKHSINFHEVLVVEHPHDFYLIYQGFLPFFFAVGALFRKGLGCISIVVLVFYHKIDGCKISFSNLLYGLKEFMEASLVEFLLKKVSPKENLISILLFF